MDSGSNNPGGSRFPNQNTFNASQYNQTGYSYPSYDQHIPNPLDALRNNSDSTSAVAASQPLMFSGLAPDMSRYRIEAEDYSSYDYDSSNADPDFLESVTDLFYFVSFRLGISLLSNPISLSQTLTQVQYLPNEYIAHIELQNALNAAQDDDYDLDHIHPSLQPGAGAGTQYRQSISTAKTNHNGYAVSAANSDNKFSLVQPYQINSTDRNKLSMLRAVYSHPSEGFFALFKGSFSKFTYEMLHLTLQPTIESLLNESLGVYSDSSSLLFSANYVDTSSPSPFTMLASYVIVGYLLTPLEIVRTRLEVQTQSPMYRKYNGIWDTLKKISFEEGGIVSGVYLNSFHAIPSLIQHTITPFFSKFGPMVFNRVLYLDPYVEPLKVGIFSLIWRTTQLLVSIPIDTIRKRLLAQPNYKSIKSSLQKQSQNQNQNQNISQSSNFRELRTTVRTSPIKYTGMINCAWRIITEEGRSSKYNPELIASTLQQEQSFSPYQNGQRPSSAFSSTSSSNAHSNSSSSQNQRKAGRSASQLPQQQKSYKHYNISDPPRHSPNYWSLRGLYPGLSSSVAINLAVFCLSFVAIDDDETAY